MNAYGADSNGKNIKRLLCLSEFSFAQQLYNRITLRNGATYEATESHGWIEVFPSPTTHEKVLNEYFQAYFGKND